MRSSIEEQFIAWLTTQTNANGSLFLERVARRYANNMRSAPPKLDLPLSAEECSVFKCQTVTDFERIYQVFVNAPNYREVNRNSDHGAFSAGLTAYRRYLEHLERQNESETQTNITLSFVDFAHPELCTCTDPIECKINGHVLRKANWNWRDLLVEVAEYFLRTDSHKVQSFTFKTGRQFMTKQKPSNCVCRQLSNRQFIIVGFNIPDLVRMIGKLCVHCGIDHKDVIITYVPKDCAATEVTKVTANLESNNMKSIQDFDAEKFKSLVITKSDSVNSEISLPNGERLSVDELIDLDEAKMEMDKILRTHFAQFRGYSNKRLLYEAVKIALPMFLNDNGFYDEDTVLAVAKHLLGDRYVFYDLHIWQNVPDYPMSNSGLLIDFGRANGGVFDKETAEQFLHKVKIQTYLTNIIRQNNGNEDFLVYDKGKIILTEALDLTVERLEKIFIELRKLFEKENVEYVILRDINEEWFGRLPAINGGHDWKPLLLQEIIRRYPGRGFSVIKSGLPRQDIFTLAAAIVNESSMVNTFADIAHLYLLKRRQLPEHMLAEDLRLVLREAGMLAGNELIYNLHKVIGRDHRFAFVDNNQTVKILER